MRVIEEKSYTRIGRSKELTGKDYIIYRGLEILPGFLAWITLSAILFFSWYMPVATSFFIIAFDVYWILKAIFFSAHTTASYRLMRDNLKINWMDKINDPNIKISPELSKHIKNYRDIYHLIIFPTYREPYETLHSSIESIKNSNWPKDRIILVLAIEKRGGDQDLQIAEALKKKYGSIFANFLITIHPDDLVGEIPGKGSNETWAAKEAQKLIDSQRIPYERIIVSSLDSDTKVYPDYFTLVAYKYLTEPDPLRASYQPIPVYHNNIWDAPAFSRIVATSDTFWQMVQQSRPERLTTFSSHSMPFKSLVEMDFWQTNIVSEDSRIFWQALLFYNGQWRTIPLYYPVSMDANLASTFIQTAVNIYRQHLRWGWGVENIPYLLFGFIKNKKIALKKKIFYAFNQLEGFWSLSTNAFIIFFLGWLPPFLGKGVFSTTLLAYNLPRITRFLMSLAMVGLATSAVLALHLLPTRPLKKPYWKIWLILEWLLIPITGTLFSAIPGLEAQTRLMFGKYLGFWRTPKSK